MVTLGRKKKTDEDAATGAAAVAAAVVKESSAKKSGFFRKQQQSEPTTTLPSTPPITTPESTEKKSRLRNERPTVDTIEVPSPTATPDRNVAAASTTILSSENHNYLHEASSIVSELTVQQDPPARMARTSSLEAGQSAASSHSGKNQQQPHVFLRTTQLQPPPDVAATPKENAVEAAKLDPPEKNFVNQMLGMVDMSCVSAHLGRAPSSIDYKSSSNNRNLEQGVPLRRQVLGSYRPDEWGVAPTLGVDDHEDDVSNVGLNANAPQFANSSVAAAAASDGHCDNDTLTMGESILSQRTSTTGGTSLTKMALAERVAQAAAMEPPAPAASAIREPSSPRKRPDETFEMVYKKDPKQEQDQVQDPAPETPKSSKRSMNMQKWVKKLGTKESKQPQPDATTTTASSPSMASKLKTRIARRSSLGDKPDAAPTSSLSTKLKTLGIARRNSLGDEPVDAESDKAVLLPADQIEDPATAKPKSSTGKKQGRLMRAFHKKRDESSPKSVVESSSTVSDSLAESGSDGSDEYEPPDEVKKQQQQQQQQYRKVLKSIKTPITMPLFTVEEEEDSMEVDGDEFKVRVPGVENADSYISDKDLIGDEVVDEIYASIDESIVKEEQIREDFMATPQLMVGPSNRSPTRSPMATTTAAENTEEVLQTPSPSPVADTGILNPLTKFGKTATSKSKTGYQPFKIREDASTPILRSKSWKERILGFKKGDGNSANGKSVGERKKKKTSTSEKVEGTDRAKKKSAKPQWKSAVDPATGKTYYYHRKTRETTWARPAELDIVSPPAEKKEPEIEPEADVVVSEVEQHISEEEEEERSASIPVTATPKVVVSTAVSSHDETKRDIAHVLRTVSPSKGENAERLVAEYEGRDEELLEQLRGLTEEQPFDEPVLKMDQQQPDDEVDKVSVDDKGALSRQSTFNRARTGMSLYSGLSGKFSRISEKTEQIKNLSRKPGLVSIKDVESTTSISTKNDDIPGENSNSSEKNANTKIPKNIPVPRLRELNVEEFTLRDRAYRTRGTNRRSKPTKQESSSPSEPAAHGIENNLTGDNDDADGERSTSSFAATDSISALSDAELSFLERKEAYGDARRRALDRAIAQEDWDLAAQLSEGMRRGTKGASTVRRDVPSEWKQSEMDRFISDNDWDAVAAYIAEVRSKSKLDSGSSGGAAVHTNSHHRGRAMMTRDQAGVAGVNAVGENPQKRFGALSQLQHRDLNSFDSYSSYSTYDSEYTSESYEGYSHEERSSRPAGRVDQPKEFAC